MTARPRGARPVFRSQATCAAALPTYFFRINYQKVEKYKYISASSARMPHDELFRALSLYESGRDIASGRIGGAGVAALLMSVPELPGLSKEGRGREAAASF